MYIKIKKKTNKKILLVFGIIILAIAIFYSKTIREDYNDKKNILKDVNILTNELKEINKIQHSKNHGGGGHNRHHGGGGGHERHHGGGGHKHKKCPDMDKYIRKTKIPSCTGKYEAHCNRKQGKFIRKTKIPGCPRVPDSNKYILKTSIQPDNTKKHKHKHKIDGIIRNRIIDSVLDNNNYSTHHRHTGHSNHLQSSGLEPTNQCKFIDHRVKSSSIFNTI